MLPIRIRVFDIRLNHHLRTRTRWPRTGDKHCGEQYAISPETSEQTHELIPRKSWSTNKCRGEFPMNFKVELQNSVVSPSHASTARTDPTNGARTGIQAYPQSLSRLPGTGRIAWAIRGPRSRAGLIA